jgi:hypothetical protein
MRLRLPLVFLWSALCAVAAEQPNAPAIGLNPAALEFAQQLIRDRCVVSDRKGAWRRDKPSTAQENEFIRLYGLQEYGKWHLGIDRRHSPRSKAHYKFPFGDFNALHRCGLLAVKARAHDYGYAEIETAAHELLTQIQIMQPRR